MTSVTSDSFQTSFTRTSQARLHGPHPCTGRSGHKHLLEICKFSIFYLARCLPRHLKLRPCKRQWLQLKWWACGMVQCLGMVLSQYKKPSARSELAVYIAANFFHILASRQRANLDQCSWISKILNQYFIKSDQPNPIVDSFFFKSKVCK